MQAVSKGWGYNWLANESFSLKRNREKYFDGDDYPARALRALGLLLADGALTVGRGETF